MRSFTFLAFVSLLGVSSCQSVADKGNAAALIEESDSDFQGLRRGEAESLAEERGLRHRIIEVDGEMRPATRDYRIDRVSFSIRDGIVTRVSRG